MGVFQNKCGVDVDELFLFLNCGFSFRMYICLSHNEDVFRERRKTDRLCEFSASYLRVSIEILNNDDVDKKKNNNNHTAHLFFVRSLVFVEYLEHMHRRSCVQLSVETSRVASSDIYDRAVRLNESGHCLNVQFIVDRPGHALRSIYCTLTMKSHRYEDNDPRPITTDIYTRKSVCWRRLNISRCCCCSSLIFLLFFSSSLVLQ